MVVYEYTNIRRYEYLERLGKIVYRIGRLSFEYVLYRIQCAIKKLRHSGATLLARADD